MATRTLLTALLMAPAFALPASAQYGLTYLNQIDLGEGEGEIVSFTADRGTLAVTGVTDTVRLFTLDVDGSATARSNVTFGNPFSGTTIGNISSTAVDPLGRGFGVATIIPEANGTTVGKLGFYDYATGAVLGTVDVGYHPDSVKFSPDGSKLIVANEGEFLGGTATNGQTDDRANDVGARGSISVIDLTSITSAPQTASLTNGHVETYDFTAANLADGVNIESLRYNVRDLATADRPNYIEPENITFDGNRVIVSLQENNALGVFDTSTNRWAEMFDLGMIENTIDASDREISSSQGTATIDDVVKGMPMPDAMATFDVAGQTYVVTANEGDFRVDDGDRKRVNSDFGGIDTPSTITSATRNNAVLGRLRVSSIESDPDGDNLIDDAITPGTRSFSIWNADTGELVADCGSLESFLLAEDATRHNSDLEDSSPFDRRSDDKGPEPEGLDVITLPDGTVLLAIGMERQNGIVLADVTDPAAPVLIDYLNGGDATLPNGQANPLYAPESLHFIAAANSPTGQVLLVVGFEGVEFADGVVRGNGVGIYAVPEPTTAAMLGGATLLWRRRR